MLTSRVLDAGIYKFKFKAKYIETVKCTEVPSDTIQWVEIKEYDGYTSFILIGSDIENISVIPLKEQ